MQQYTRSSTEKQVIREDTRLDTIFSKRNVAFRANPYLISTLVFTGVSQSWNFYKTLASLGGSYELSEATDPFEQGEVIHHIRGSLSTEGNRNKSRSTSYSHQQKEKRSRSTSFSHIDPPSRPGLLTFLVLVRTWTFTSSKRTSGPRSENRDKASHQHHRFDDPSAPLNNRTSDTRICQ